MFNRLVLNKKRLVPLFAFNPAIKQSGMKHRLALIFCFFFIKEKEDFFQVLQRRKQEGYEPQGGTVCGINKETKPSISMRLWLLKSNIWWCAFSGFVFCIDRYRNRASSGCLLAAGRS
jgi:hypothetical protein